METKQQIACMMMQSRRFANEQLLKNSLKKQKKVAKKVGSR